MIIGILCLLLVVYVVSTVAKSVKKGKATYDDTMQQAKPGKQKRVKGSQLHYEDVTETFGMKTEGLQGEDLTSAVFFQTHLLKVMLANDDISEEVYQKYNEKIFDMDTETV